MSSSPAPRPQASQVPEMQVPEDLGVKYVNLVRIAHSPWDLVFDFAHSVPGDNPAQVCARIVMSPLGAKLFYRALAENLARYEEVYGEIGVPGDRTLAEYLFRPPHSPEPPPQK